MAAYPNIPFILETTDRRVDKMLVSVARSGAPKFRRLQERARGAWNIVHRGLDDDQRKVIEDFLDANRMIPFTITYPCADGTVYSVQEETGEMEWSKVEGYWQTEIAVIEA